MKSLIALVSAFHLAFALVAASAAQRVDPVLLTSALLANVQTLIGDQGLVEGAADHAPLHGLAGCGFQEALSGDCAAGFAAGVVGSLYAGFVDRSGSEANLAELLGAFAGFVCW